MIGSPAIRTTGAAKSLSWRVLHEGYITPTTKLADGRVGVWAGTALEMRAFAHFETDSEALFQPLKD